MFFTGLDPRTMKSVYVARNPDEKAMQRALMQFRNGKNVPLVRKALRLAGREDLIGYDRESLVPPEGPRPSRGTGRPLEMRPTAARGQAPSRRTEERHAPKRSAKWAKAKPRKK